MRKNRFRDKSKVPVPAVVKPRNGEDYSERHERRLTLNLSILPLIQRWCKDRGIYVKVSNEGHHWKFFAGERFAEWWPSSAKFVFERNYQDGIHVHDWKQAKWLIEHTWNPAPVNVDGVLPKLETAGLSESKDSDEFGTGVW